MKIGLVTPSWPGTDTANGIATAVRYLQEGLSSRGHEVTIISINDVSSHDPSVIALPRPRRATLVERLAARLDLADPYQTIMAERLAAAARDAVQRRGIEVLIMEETQGWAATVQRSVAIPVIVTLHGPWFLHRALQSTSSSAQDRRREKREAVALMTSAGITSPSHDVLERTRKHIRLDGIPAAVIPNPISIGPDVSAPLPEDDSPIPLLFVGRFDHHKGGDIVLAAFAKLVAQGLNVRLTFVGPDRGIINEAGSKVSLMEALSTLPSDVADRINVTGPLNKNEIDCRRRCHPITLIASRYENFNYTLLEALSFGSIVVSTNAGGPAEIVKDEVTGLLVSPGDPTAISDACIRIINCKSWANKIGHAAKQDIENRLNPDCIARSWESFISLISRKWAM